jgi:phosphatidylserine/phosphatidylglycerophosphate/cardiolipin synthase-like enzyme
MIDDPPSDGHRLAALVVRMSASHARAFGAAVAGEGAWSEAGAARALRAVANPGYRQVAAALCAWWRERPSLAGAHLALMVDACAAACAIEHEREVLDAVVTGPASAHVSLRQTRAVLHELIERAQRDLLIVSFAAYKVEELVQALAAAAARGVQCRLVLETAVDSAGRLSHDAAQAFDSLGGRVSFFTWPADQRPAGAGAALHAKVVIADARVAFITSANLTGAALEHNLEVGVLVRGGSVPARLHEHFLALMASGVLQPVG